jgi:putative flippase GtrA
MKLPTRIAPLLQHPLLAKLFRFRYIKFGLVGASGTVVNLCVLFIAQEFLFTAITSPDMRLNVSLMVAIFVATLNNFFWNRAWTWHDRKHLHTQSLLLHFAQYCMAVWMGIVLQVLLTKLFVIYLYYLLANALAILLASLVNFSVNHFWTFRKREIK